MICLALECSSSRRSVALARDGEPLAEVVLDAGRYTPLLGMIARALGEARLAHDEIGSIAVGLGPGSYTGIRNAIATAQGWELAHGVRMFGVGSLEATALRAQLLGHQGPAVVVADAHRGEWYLAEFDLTAKPPAPLAPLRIGTSSELNTLRNRGHLVVGPDLEALGLEALPIFPDGSTLARIAASLPAPTPPEFLEPVYLRPTAFVKHPSPCRASVSHDPRLVPHPIQYPPDPARL